IPRSTSCSVFPIRGVSRSTCWKRTAPVPLSHSDMVRGGPSSQQVRSRSIQQNCSVLVGWAISCNAYLTTTWPISWSLIRHPQRHMLMRLDWRATRMAHSSLLTVARHAKGLSYVQKLFLIVSMHGSWALYSTIHLGVWTTLA